MAGGRRLSLTALALVLAVQIACSYGAVVGTTPPPGLVPIPQGTDYADSDSVTNVAGTRVSLGYTAKTGHPDAFEDLEMKAQSVAAPGAGPRDVGPGFTSPYTPDFCGPTGPIYLPERRAPSAEIPARRGRALQGEGGGEFERGQEDLDLDLGLPRRRLASQPEPGFLEKANTKFVIGGTMGAIDGEVDATKFTTPVSTIVFFIGPAVVGVSLASVIPIGGLNLFIGPELQANFNPATEQQCPAAAAAGAATAPGSTSVDILPSPGPISVRARSLLAPAPEPEKLSLFYNLRAVVKPQWELNVDISLELPDLCTCTCPDVDPRS
eukprot:tig00000227_g19827.t1